MARLTEALPNDEFVVDELEVYFAPPEGRASNGPRVERISSQTSAPRAEPSELWQRAARRLLHQRISGRLADVPAHYKDGLRRGRVWVTGGRHPEWLRPECRGLYRRRPGEIGGKWLHGSEIPQFRNVVKRQGFRLGYTTAEHAMAQQNTPVHGF